MKRLRFPGLYFVSPMLMLLLAGCINTSPLDEGTPEESQASQEGFPTRSLTTPLPEYLDFYVPSLTITFKYPSGWQWENDAYCPYRVCIHLANMGTSQRSLLNLEAREGTPLDLEAHLARLDEVTSIWEIIEDRKYTSEDGISLFIRSYRREPDPYHINAPSIGERVIFEVNGILYDIQINLPEDELGEEFYRDYQYMLETIKIKPTPVP